MPRRLAQAIRHVHFEDLGSFATPISGAGYDIAYLDAAKDDVGGLDPLAADLLVVLGGPIGANDHVTYPVVADEIRLLRSRLEASRPTLGICLGAQLMAAALGAAVYPAREKEIGWSTVDLTTSGKRSVLSPLDGVPVLHWHGDTFDLPAGCDLLASTDICPNQAFSRGVDVLGLQFHPELLTGSFEHWLIGHASELASAGVNPLTLRNDARTHCEKMRLPTLAMMQRWLAGLLENA